MIPISQLTSAKLNGSFDDVLLGPDDGTIAFTSSTFQAQEGSGTAVLQVQAARAPPR